MEKVRAQALIDLMEYSLYDGVGSSEEGNKDLAVLQHPPEEEDEFLELLSYLPLNTVFQAVDYPSRKRNSLQTKQRRTHGFREWWSFPVL